MFIAQLTKVNPHVSHPGWASRVELWTCGACGSETRFPRYNNPRTLLFESRTGQQKGAKVSQLGRLSMYLSSESLQVSPYSEVSPELCTS